MNAELQLLGRKYEDLNQNLSATVKQRDQERSEITKLNEKLKQLQQDTEKVVRALKGMATLGIANYDWRNRYGYVLLKEKNSFL